MKLLMVFLAVTITSFISNGQQNVEGEVSNNGNPIPFAKVKLPELKKAVLADEAGKFVIENVPDGSWNIEVFSYEFELYQAKINVPSKEYKIEMIKGAQEIEDVVVSGTLKEVSKKESTVNVEVFSNKFFKKNPNPTVYDALQNVNGVRPQLNCNICATGDIHINGLEGPYTMILIDGMPIVSSLSTVYGLSGIPSSLIQRIEIVKGPASTLYGSEAIGGVINIITKNPTSAPKLSFNLFTTSWLENNVDVAMKNKVGKKANVLTGINYFNYDFKKDNNNDGFTDVTLQDRISVFQKWNFKRKDYRLFTIAGRYLYEDRWGGQMDWTPDHRGSDSIYGESIYTSRWELMGGYQLPMKEKVFVTTSINNHNQNSIYGTTDYQAKQFNAFGQIYWDKKIASHDFIIGSAVRYMNFDDNTPATESSDTISPRTQPSITWLPGVYAQDEISLNDKHKLLVGARYDYNNHHGSIFTPRVGYKWTMNANNILRLNTGTGYRIVNIFTEDHAALIGARDVIIADDIAPEQSYNANLNFNKSIVTKKKKMINIDVTAFYTYFTNRIVADYDTDPNQINYTNLSSHAISSGVSLNLTINNLIRNLNINAGGTFMDISVYEEGIKYQQILTEKFTGTWSVSYAIPKAKLTFDYTGNVYSPMRLPLLNEADPRAPYSPWWSIQNIQMTYKPSKTWEIYGGVKNFLNWTPNKNTPFMIARSHDPFDKDVQFNADGDAMITPNNPYGLTFDPTYVYAPNQGIRFFLGVRYTFNK